MTEQKVAGCWRTSFGLTSPSGAGCSTANIYSSLLRTFVLSAIDLNTVSKYGLLRFARTSEYGPSRFARESILFFGEERWKIIIFSSRTILSPVSLL
jgi:hypothetical protein